MYVCYMYYAVYTECIIEFMLNNNPFFVIIAIHVYNKMFFLTEFTSIIYNNQKKTLLFFQWCFLKF